MEACGEAHHRHRIFTGTGYTVHPIALRFIKPFVKSNRNDTADAEGIRHASTPLGNQGVQRPSMLRTREAHRATGRAGHPWDSQPSDNPRNSVSYRMKSFTAVTRFLSATESWLTPIGTFTLLVNRTPLAAKAAALVTKAVAFITEAMDYFTGAGAGEFIIEAMASITEAMDYFIEAVAFIVKATAFSLAAMDSIIAAIASVMEAVDSVTEAMGLESHWDCLFQVIGSLIVCTLEIG
uniref:Transposase n=1 Tax=Candidatus Kentrum eta TaxID=2126337 RepID=A0A450UPG9_9GAMM|nr:MAG: hypothetical protein BECKH772A_GA0070896_1005910 [Candidatus Kentron sp. H]VFJ94409.1 MAG: hypothetical protein BECKH772B_GA0070898_1006110 [Candidatus Kentron sp. H]VFK01060.1 MAG: hypothetical protein BECKH772C_GA0070978_100578 [Candidatus Kentron sp. H]